MKYNVLALRRAEADIRGIVRWIARRSPQGAASWLDALEEVLGYLADHAGSCAAAAEAAECGIPIKQSLFATRRGRTYRAIFIITGNQVRILRVRGPGQPPLLEDELY
jgi:plasmid stabilization system protein ParE